MSKRISDEGRIINFFETGHIEAVKAVFNMVKSTVKRRLDTEVSFDEAVKSVQPKKRKKRAASNVGAQSATAFPGANTVAS